MTLVFNRTASLNGEPGLHVFIAGTSKYKHIKGGDGPRAKVDFKIKQLSSAATSAYKIYEWLLENKDSFPVPLATIRMLLSPSPQEETLAGVADACTRDNFVPEIRRWRDDASFHDSNMTFFYFAGHGIQRKRNDAVLLLEDFGDPDFALLEKAADLSNIVAGMVPPQNAKHQRARRQLYFIDTCRVAPKLLRKYESKSLDISPVLEAEAGSEDDRAAPIFFAAMSGEKAYALSGKQTLFSKALLKCFDGAAGELPQEQGHADWLVSVFSLLRALKIQIEELNRQYLTKQKIALVGKIDDIKILSLLQPPKVDVFVVVEPVAALPHITVLIKDDRNNLIKHLPPVIDPHPYHESLPAGLYSVSAIVNEPPIPPYVDFFLLMDAKPPSKEWRAKVVR